MINHQNGQNAEKFNKHVQNTLTEAELKKLIKQQHSSSEIKCSDGEALALYVDMDLTKSI